MLTPAVTHHDNRGDDEVPFGFVYFNDNSRVGYAHLPENASEGGVFPTHPGVWDAATSPRHFALAREYLHDKGVVGF